MWLLVSRQPRPAIDEVLLPLVSCDRSVSRLANPPVKNPIQCVMSSCLRRTHWMALSKVVRLRLSHLLTATSRVMSSPAR